MKRLLPLVASLTAVSAWASEPALTIYNQNFAVVRDAVPLDLKPGVNEVRFYDTTAQLEPDSVILRDPAGKVPLQVLEQSYRNDPISQGLLLSLFEGKTIDFVIHEVEKPDRTVPGKIIRSGYAQGNTGEPIVEVDGKIRFGLPGQPIFPSLGDDTILKPMLSWQLQASAAAKLEAQLCYVTSGLSWEADYNIVSPEKGDLIDIVGWVTMNNQSGKTFQEAKVKLMAGEVNRIQPQPAPRAYARMADMAGKDASGAVTEKAFDEYHLYTLPRAVTLRDHETKQVEFVRATGVKAERIYVYDAFSEASWLGYPMENLRTNAEFGSESGKKVAVMREFKNSEENHLGLPLPAGKLRFYRANDEHLEFVGENKIDHTPKDETVRVVTGNAFDLVGERRRVDFKLNRSESTATESIEIKVRNHKKEPVEIRVVEHLFRWTTWEITQKSMDFQKLNAQEIEFRVALKPDEEKTVTYTVRYSW